MADQDLIDGRKLYDWHESVLREEYKFPPEWANLSPGEQRVWIETAKLVNTHFKPIIDLLEAQRDTAAFEADLLTDTLGVNE